MITLSKILDNQTNVDKYTKLYDQLATEFHAAFYNPQMNGYAEGYQTANALALKLPNVVPSNLRASVLKALVDNIVNNNNHMTGGIICAAALFPVLTEAGYHDLAVTVATQTTYPSYGFMFNNAVQNATTMWETFYSFLNGSAGDNSLNHHMFNSIGAWFYRYLAGIQLNGFNEDLIIHPRLTTLLLNVDAEVHTINGPILVSWHRYVDDNTVTYDVTIPYALHSIITFEPITPTAHCISIEESGTLIWHRSSSVVDTNNNGIVWLRPNSNIEGAMNVRVEGGLYHWKVQWN
jgi:alpha-L-rhamnosidase